MYEEQDFTDRNLDKDDDIKFVPLIQDFDKMEPRICPHMMQQMPMMNPMIQPGMMQQMPMMNPMMDLNMMQQMPMMNPMMDPNMMQQMPMMNPMMDPNMMQQMPMMNPMMCPHMMQQMPMMSPMMQPDMMHQMPMMNPMMQPDMMHQMPMMEKDTIEKAPMVNPSTPTKKTTTTRIDMEVPELNSLAHELSQKNKFLLEEDSRNIDAKVEKILIKIETSHPSIIKTLMAYRIPYPVAQNIIRKIIRITLMYEDD